MRSATLALCLAAGLGCDDGGGEGIRLPGDAALTPDGAPDLPTADATAPDAAAPGAEVTGGALMGRLAGLWTGAATMTPLGIFPAMHMDFRAASPTVLFARADLDAGNNLRFAFSVETLDGEDVLVYRNGGYFVGLLRDSWTRLVEHEGDRWRFCSVDRGCEYLDATWTFDGDDRVRLAVAVRGRTHVVWDARRREARAVPAVFPPAGPNGDGAGPFPDLPALRVDAAWAEPAPEGASVWLLLSTTPCGFTGACVPSRAIGASVEAGATEATLLLPQVHAGTYRLNVVLDRNGNFTRRLFPDRGDGIAPLDAEIDIAPTGETRVARRLSLTVP